MPTLSTPEARLTVAIGWTLLHILWQGSFLGIVLAVALRAMRNSPATTRYALCCGALAALVLFPLLTLVQIELTAGHPAATALLYLPLLVGKDSALSDAGSSTGSGFLSFVRTLQPWFPVVMWIWVLGTGLKAIRIVVGLIRSRALRLTSQACNAAPLFEMVRRLSGPVGISQNVQLFVSPDTGIPVVIGWRKPAILLPPSFLQDLSSEEMETIIVHELAHIQRRDYPMNVAQAGVEALFFYHPVVWWISRQIRREREHCCDDIAVRVSGSPLVCAKALTALEERRSSTVSSLSPAASRGDLTMRIHRILASQPTKPRPGGVTISLISLSLCTSALLAALSIAVADTMSPLMAEASTPNLAGSGSKQSSSQPPNMDCTYYKRVGRTDVSGAPAQMEPHPGSCVDTRSDTGTFYCKQIDNDQQQEQSACQWKVQRLHQWQEQLKRSK
jgi:beta-lactamase regulating signal transducer with metallopeptidase domain